MKHTVVLLWPFSESLPLFDAQSRSESIRGLADINSNGWIAPIAAVFGSLDSKSIPNKFSLSPERSLSDTCPHELPIEAERRVVHHDTTVSEET